MYIHLLYVMIKVTDFLIIVLKIAFLLDVSEDVMLSYWYDLTPMGIQIKQLSKDLIETREILGTTRAKLDRLESTLSRHTVSSQESIELEIDSNQDEDEQHVSFN